MPHLNHHLSVNTLAILLVALAVFAGPGGVASARDAVGPVLTGKVTRVVDGDTLDVLLSSGRIRVRLQGVDAPEKGQRWFVESTGWMKAALMDRQVELEPYSQDRYERLLATVYLDGVDINAELVRLGHAWAYRRYMRRGDAALCTLEASARRGGVGLWALPRVDRPAPWQFRSTHGQGPYIDYTASNARECVAAIGRH